MSRPLRSGFASLGLLQPKTASPATVTSVPRTARAVSRSPRKTRPSGIAKSGEVEESTAATATSASFTPVTKSTELPAVIAPRSATRTNTPRPARPI